jgi:hypothetical protein
MASPCLIGSGRRRIALLATKIILTDYNEPTLICIDSPLFLEQDQFGSGRFCGLPMQCLSKIGIVVYPMNS